ncbi:PREDICTED: odorant receptor 4-like [Trachymyrmex cornetzi]|uniref:odorant receptor 4-like n=1 Tax=Trachymyrmex cornetzi TaxID=471704 RepID=UPI00084F508C|nr:PREDICTED: odorant receptor 4-like [Trachymyrmex cornetzi]
MTEYFVDQEKYFYLILLHINVATCIGAIAYIATGTMLIGYLKHACGMFKIASYRIERAMINKIFKNNTKNEITIYKAMIYAVDIHRKAMKYAEFLISNFEGSFLFLIAVSVCCLSLNLFRIFQSVTFGNSKEEFLLHFTIVGVILLYMFLANYAGQEIMDHNNHVFSTAYNVRWYTAPLSIQKLILFLLQRSSKTFSLNVGGLFQASLKCFASLTSASISYFTVIYSTQQ